MYNHILFDADNTLLDFDKAQLISFKTTLLYFGVEFSKEIYKKYELINHNLWHQFERGIISKEVVQIKRFLDLFDTLGIHINAEHANSIYQRELCKQSWLIPHAEEICKELFLNATLSIVTNGVGDTQTKRIASSEINKYISFIVISEIIGYAKPNIEFFNETFKVIGCRKTDKVLIVGDSIESDIIGGKNAGIDTCWYNPHGLTPPPNLKINHIIADLYDLKRLVLEKQCL